MLSDELRLSLGAMAARYAGALQMDRQALDYLSGRGISQDEIGSYRLGVVDGSFPEHADYTGRICIPYLTKLGGVASLKFRVAHDCTESCQHSKYITPYPTRPYNTLAFERAEQYGYIGITEGEFDALILGSHCDIPAVGIPGVDTWTKHPEWRAMFDGFGRVLVFADQDEAGQKFKARVLSDIDSAVPVTLPAKDVNDTYLRHGADVIREAAGF